MARREIPRELSIYINDRQVVNSFAGINRAVSQTRNEMNNLNRNSATYSQDLLRLGGELGQLTTRQSAFRDEIASTTQTMSRSSSRFAEFRDGFIAAFSIGAAISAFSAAVSGAYKTITKFEQGLADLSAITGSTGDDLKYLKDQAIILGEKTKGGAQAVVEAYALIASAKPELLDNIEALNMVTEATLTLAQAAGMEMPAAASALTDAMNQFNAPAEEASVFVDALANGAKYGSAEIPQLTEALLKFGAVAKSSNINIQESTALIELLAENGLKGAEAGTSLRNVLLKLSAPDALPREARTEMERLGITMEFLKDKTIPIQEKFEKLKPLLKDNASIVKVFGTENATAAINIISHTDRLKELTSSMFDVGTAGEQAAIKMNTVSAKTELLKAKYDSLILSVGTGTGVVSGFFKFFIEGADAALTGLIRLNTSYGDLNKRAKQEGGKSGVSIFQERLNLAKMSGSTDEEGIARAIRTTAQNQYKIYEKEALALDKKTRELAKVLSSESDKEFFITKGVDPKRKEALSRELGEQAAIIREAGKKIKSINAIANEEEVKAEADTAKAKTDINDDAAKKAQAAADKKEAAEKKAAKDELDRILALAKAKGDLAKAELESFIANNRSKLDASQELTPEILAAETTRLQAILQAQITYNNEERNKKIADLEAKQALEKTSLETLNIEKQALNLDYETTKQGLEYNFHVITDGNKKKYDEEQKVLRAEQLLADNELALAKAQTKDEEDRIKQEQAYKKQLVDYKQLLFDKKITQEEYDRFVIAARKSQDQINREREIELVKSTLGGLSQVAFAIGEMFGQSKELAIVQAGINGAMAVTSILAQYPKFDGGFAMFAAIAAAGITTIAQVAKITKAKPPKQPKFFYGGHTGSTAAMGYDEFGPMTGIVHKNEYVIPESMTANPRYANTIAWIEQERTGKRVNKFANGGGTSPGAVPSAVMGENESRMESLLSAVLFRLENPVSPNLQLLFGYEEAKKVQDLNNERDASTKNGIVSE